MPAHYGSVLRAERRYAAWQRAVDMKDEQIQFIKEGRDKSD
jgi:hypothetical protein